MTVIVHCLIFFVFLAVFWRTLDVSAHKFLSSNRHVTPDVLACFAKVRTSATVDSDFRRRLDAVAKTSRLDAIVRTLMEKVDTICSQSERDYVVDYFGTHENSIKLTESIMRNLTNEEKDHLNIWSNLNDTNSEQQMFLHKIHRLSTQNQTTLRSSLNSILNTFVVASLPKGLTSALSIFNTTDLDQIKMYAREDQTLEVKKFIANRLTKSNLTTPQQFDAYRFMTQIFLNENKR